MGEKNQLRGLILETVPQQYHEELCGSMERLGPEKTFFTKVFYLWTEEQKKLAMIEIGSRNQSGGRYRTLFDYLRVNNTLHKYESHKRYVEKSYSRFRICFKYLEEDQIKCHDDSKISSILEIMGYTARWEWGLDCDLWREALEHHYQVFNLHHCHQFFIPVDTHFISTIPITLNILLENPWSRGFSRRVSLI